MSKQPKTNPEVEALKNQLARILADYDNLQKRTERQSLELYLNASQRIVKQLIPVLDMLHDAQKHIKDAGLAITIKEFEDVLAREGYNKIEPKEGEKFDTLLHEAIDVVETDKKSEDNTIASTVLVGWMQGDPPANEAGGTVVRVAKVVVKKFKGEK